MRRFVNRIATLAVAFEDFSQGPGQHFLELVRQLVDRLQNKKDLRWQY